MGHLVGAGGYVLTEPFSKTAKYTGGRLAFGPS
jgi:hypothetical protein